MSATINDVLNQVRAESSGNYQRLVPLAIGNNLTNVADAVMSSQMLQNEYLSALLNRISMERFTSRMFRTPYTKFIRGTNKYGDTIEEIYVNLCNAHEYNPSIAENEVYKREIPDVNAVFHRRNSRIFYKQTIQYDDLYASFLSENGMRGLVARIVDAMYSSANTDIFKYIKLLISEYNPYYYKVQVPASTAENANQIVTTLKSMSNMLEFPSRLYNRFGVDQWTEKSRQVLIVRADVAANLDVNSLAQAFNLQYADFIAGSYITIDSFSDSNMIALLTDDEFFQIYENLAKFTENYNGQGLNWQYFFHKWMTYSISPFSNAIAFVTTTPVAATKVDITPATITMSKGTNQQFSASITPTTAQQSVQWSLSGNNMGGTYITATGLLHIDQEESATTLTVTGTSPATPSISGTATVTLS